MQLQKFFWLFSNHSWPSPVHLTPMRETAPGLAALDETVWNPSGRGWNDVMPVRSYHRSFLCSALSDHALPVDALGSRACCQRRPSAVLTCRRCFLSCFRW